MNTKRIYIKDLNANDTFYLPGSNTPYVCERRTTMGNRTLVTYRIGEDRFEFHRVNLSTVDLLEV